jgi:putative transposase
MSYAALCRWLTLQRRIAPTSWLAEVPVHTSQQALKDLRRALDDFFDKNQPGKLFPQFKKKGSRDAFRYPDPGQFAIDQANGRVKLPKLGWVRYRKSRGIEGTVRQVTVGRDGEAWYVSVLARRGVPDPVHPATTEVGVDLGITRFATLSDGSVYESLHARRSRERQVARLQRQLARKVKFSNNWQKQRRRIQRLHRRIRDARSDFIHKVSTEISENQAVVVLEDLKVANMSRSARGTPEEPGSRVRAKAGLNRAITDQGWAEFRRQLEYKLAWRGGALVLVEPAHTSQRCSACGHTAAGNRRSQASFACVRCGHEDHADLNAAKNILAAGRAAAACGGYPDVVGPLKQESPGGAPCAA